MESATTNTDVKKPESVEEIEAGYRQLKRVLVIGLFYSLGTLGLLLFIAPNSYLTYLMIAAVASEVIGWPLAWRFYFQPRRAQAIAELQAGPGAPTGTQYPDVGI
jgi:hypothetical protein